MKLNDVTIINKVKKLRAGATAILAIGLLKIMRDQYKVSKADINAVIEEAKRQEERLTKQR